MRAYKNVQLEKWSSNQTQFDYPLQHMKISDRLSHIYKAVKISSQTI